MRVLDPYLIQVFMSAILASVICSIIGVFIVLRGLSFVGAGSAHASLAGASLALLLGLANQPLAIILLATAFAISMALFTAYLSDKGVKMDVAVGVVFALYMALAVIIIGMIREYSSTVWGYVFGDILGVSSVELMALSVTAIAVTLIIGLLFDAFKFITFDPEGAEACGLPYKTLNYIMLVLIAIITSVSLKCIGAVLVFTLIVTPALSAYQFTHKMEDMVILAVIAAVFSSIVGLIISLILNISASASIVLVSSTVCMISIALSPKRKVCKECLEIKIFER